MGDLMDYKKLLEPLSRRILALVGRALIETVTDTDKMQRLKIQALADESLEDVERIQEYGFTSVPKSGAEAIFVSLGGNREHTVVIAVDDRRYRLKGLAEGEVALYSDEGDKIVLKRGNKIEVTTKTFTVNTEKTSITNAQGDLVKILSDWMQETINAKVATSLGPQSLIGAQFPTIKTKLDSFKV